MSNPAVSIIMNCYNGEKDLKEAIESVYGQTFTDWEIVFWDNASTDKTQEIAQSFDHKLRYFRAEKNTPLGEARHLAVEQAQGAWIAFLDSDDYWLPDKLAKQMNALEGTSAVLCYAGVREISADDRTIREIIPCYASGNIFEKQLFQFDINLVTSMVRRSALKQFGLNFDKNISASEEYNLFMRLMAHGEVCTVPEVLGVWRISPNSLTDRAIAKLAHERHYTLHQIKDENPGIEEKYPKAFQEAYARGYYYQARYLFSINDKAEARRVIRSIASSSLYYKALAIIAHIPFAWSFLHGNSMHGGMLKRRLSQIIGLSKRAKPNQE